MNLKNILSIFMLLASLTITAQVGIGTTTPEGALDITSTTNGLVPPRVVLTATNASAPVVNPNGGGAPIAGTTVWNTATAGSAPNNVVPGLYVWNGSIWVLVNYSDGDFHEVGTTLPPDAITDDVFRTGKVAIGKTTAASALDIQDNTSTNAASIASTGSDNVLLIQRSGSKSGNNRGLYVDYVNSDTGSDTQRAIFNYIRGGAGTGSRYGVYNDIQSASGGSNQILGIYNQLNSSNGTGAHTGIYNRLAGNISRTKTGVNNYITGNDSGAHTGVNNNFASSSQGSGLHIGVQNQMKGTGTLRGVYNTFGSPAGNGSNRGVHNNFTNNGTGEQQGIYTSLAGSGSGTHTGVSNYITSTGNGLKNGVINTISAGTGTGIHRGTYNNVSGSGPLYGTENDVDGTFSGQTAYGTYNNVNSNNGTNIGGYFTASGTGGTAYYAAIFDQGNVGIGTITPTEKLHVIGNILASGTITPDYVFEAYYNGISNLNPKYRMLSLEEIEHYTKENKHLPGVPSALEIKKQGGVLLNRATEINLEKVEELFLHTIEASKKIKQLETKNKALNSKLNKALELLNALNEKINTIENKI